MALVATFLAGLLALFSEPHPSALEELQSRGVLRAAVRTLPSGFYGGGDSGQGVDVLLARRFAAHLGLRLDAVRVPGPRAGRLALARGDIDMVAVGQMPPPDRGLTLRAGAPYQDVQAQVVFRRGAPRPREPAGLAGRRIEVGAGTREAALLSVAARGIDGLAWREPSLGPDTGLLARVDEQTIEATIASSHLVGIARRSRPELAVAFDVGSPSVLAWTFPRGGDDSVYFAGLEFFAALRRDGELERLIARHYEHLEQFDYVAARRLLGAIDERLPAYRDLFEEAAARTALDWRLLAAIGYQESHWRADAVSETGVRGVMMLTEDTAAQMDVTNREDPAQSIDGGARYFVRVKAKIPRRIREPDHTWLALAAFNIGFGHLEDARVLTQRAGADPDRWRDVRRYLPRLSDPEWYPKTRHGFARGGQPVVYVENIRRYLDTLFARYPG